MQDAGPAAVPGGAGPPGLPGADRDWLSQAIELSRRCPPSATAFSVGAILVSAAGQLIAAGYSRQTGPSDHAEEVTLAEAARVALGDAPRAVEDLAAPQVQASDVASWLSGATLYTSLEPCLRRKSRPHSCAELIVSAGLRRVVLAWREPPLFMPGGGADWLRRAGVEVTEIPDLAGAARAVNGHLPPG